MDKSMYKEHFDVQEKHWWFVAKKTIILETIQKYCLNLSFPTSKILDAGCGCGLMLSELQKFGTTSGMDYSEDALEFSKIHFAGELKKAHLPDLVPFENNTFDLLIALDIIEHIDDDRAAILALKNLIKPNGIGVFTVPAFMFLWSKHDEINHHKRRYVLPDLKEKLESAGFKIKKITYYNTFLFPLIYIFRLIEQLTQKHSDSDVQLPNKIMNSILLKIFSLEKYFLKFMSFPFGVSLLVVVQKN